MAPRRPRLARSDLMTSDARADDEIIDVVIASARSLLPMLPTEALLGVSLVRPRSVMIRMRRVDRA